MSRYLVIQPGGAEHIRIVHQRTRHVEEGVNKDLILDHAVVPDSLGDISLVLIRDQVRDGNDGSLVVKAGHGERALKHNVRQRVGLLGHGQILISGAAVDNLHLDGHVRMALHIALGRFLEEAVIIRTLLRAAKHALPLWGQPHGQLRAACAAAA